MRYVILALWLLAWPSSGQELTETETALLDALNYWTIVNANSAPLTDFFETEAQRLIGERTALQQERSAWTQERQDLRTEREAWQTEKHALEQLRQQVHSERQLLAEDSKRIDERERRVKAAEWALRAAPAIAVALVVVGAVVWEAIDPDPR